MRTRTRREHRTSRSLVACQAARDAGDGETYARAVLGETIIAIADTEPDPTGADLHEAALRILAAKGKADSYSADEYLAACDETVIRS